MKANLSRMWRSGIAMLLALCLVVGMSPVAFATSSSSAAGSAVEMPGLNDILELEVPALDEIVEMVKEFMPEAPELALKYLEEEKYIEYIEEAIDALETMLNEKRGYYDEALPKIADSIKALEDEKNTLLTELGTLKGELEAKKAELEEVLSQQDIGSVQMPDIDLSVDVESKGEGAGEVVCNHETEGCCVVGELEAAIDHLENAIEIVENLIKDVEADIKAMMELAAKIETAVEELGETMTDVAAAAEDVAAAVAAVVEVLTTDAVDVTAAYNAAKALAVEAAEVLENAAVVAEQLSADIEEALALLTEQAEGLYAKVEETLNKEWFNNPNNQAAAAEAVAVALASAIQEVYDNLDKDLQDKLLEYDADHKKLVEDLDILKQQIEGEIKDKYAVIEPEIKTGYEETIEALKAKKADLEDELKGYQEELAGMAADAAEELVAPIKAQIERLTGDIAAVEAELALALEHLDNALECAYDEIVTEVNEAYKEAVDSLNKAIDELEKAYNEAVEALKTAAEETIKKLEDEAAAELEALEKIADEVAGLIGDIISEIEEEITAVKTAIEGILDGTIESVEDLKEAVENLGAEIVETVVSKIEEIVDAVKAAFEAATSADLVVDGDFKYVAIGDGSAASESYYDYLTEILDAKAVENGVGSIKAVNYAKADNTVAAERANLSDVSDADLITVGFSNVTFLKKALTNGADINWAPIVGAENVTYIDQLMAEVDAKLAEAGMSEDVGTIVEAYAYSAVQYATELPELINDINEVNPDALVIIVGQYNPMKDSVITMNGVTLDIGEYIDYLVAGVAVHGVAYSMLTGNAIYVDAPEASTNMAAELGMQELAALLGSNFADMYPNAIGDDYIAKKIADALNLSYENGLWGDADGDGTITSTDARLVLQYSVKLIGAGDLHLGVCDVDDDGEYTSTDARLILQYSVKLINKFPVEE